MKQNLSMTSNLRTKIYLSSSTNPYFNLATEEWIFRSLPADTHVLFLWRNQETVVIGRFQNPWTECQLPQMNEDGVLLTRRQSGGGAVFQDLGNTNFTFMSPKSHYDKNANNKIILNALKDFGIEAECSGRNDIVIPNAEGPRKISGSAFKESKDRCFHHGTLLIRANLTKLGQYLTPQKKKLESKGIASVRMRVQNMAEINPHLDHNNLSQKIIEHFCQFYQVQDKPQIELLQLDPSLKTGPNHPMHALYQYYQFLQNEQWIYGETPQFNHRFDQRFDWGCVDVLLNCNKGKIDDCTIYSDSLHPEMIEICGQILKNCLYNTESIEGAFQKMRQELPMLENELNDMHLLFIKELGSGV